MFLKILWCSYIVAMVMGAPASSPAPGVVPLEKQQPTVIPILFQSEEIESNGTFKYSYETGNGIKREETSYDKVLPKAQGRSAASGEEVSDSDSDEIHVQQGSYSYTAPDGTVISLRYIADENGFQPIGDHLPRAPKLIQIQNRKSVDEKSGRSLEATDSAPAGSEPAPALPAVEARIAEPTNDKKEVEAEVKETEAPSTTTLAEENSTTAQPTTVSTTDVTESEDSASTTESIQTTKAEISSTTEAVSESESTTKAAEETPAPTEKTTESPETGSTTLESAMSSTEGASMTKA